MARGAVFWAVWCITVSFLANYTYGILNHLLMSECMTEAQEWGRIENLTLVPWPPVLPGNITVAATIHLSRAVTGNIKASLEIRRKLGFLGYAIKIPCINTNSVPIGSCNYTDLCGMLDQRLGHDHATSAEVGVSDFFTSTTTVTTTEEVATTTDTTTSTTALPPTTTTDNNIYSMTVTAPATTSTQTPTVITTSKGPTTQVHSHPTTQDHTFTPRTPEIVGRALDEASLPGWEATDQWTTEVITSGATIQAVGHLTSDVTVADHITPSEITPIVASQATPTEGHMITNEGTPTVGFPTPSDTPAAASLATIEPTAELVQETTTSLTTIEPTAELVQETTTAEAGGSSGGDSCPAILADNGIPCNCPFHAGTYVIPPTDFALPDIGSFAGLARGDYQVKVRFYDDATGELVMCQTLEISIAEAPVTHPPTTTHAPVVG